MKQVLEFLEWISGYEWDTDGLDDPWEENEPMGEHAARMAERCAELKAECAGLRAERIAHLLLIAGLETQRDTAPMGFGDDEMYAERYTAAQEDEKKARAPLAKEGETDGRETIV